jgi:hypothetical protein
MYMKKIIDLSILNYSEFRILSSILRIEIQTLNNF